ncbi:efflux RND transporter permease subunit [Aliigemmobacter aestuarii]|uniref:Efflux RND transporter permease subunit n=1 Tax=Aliigemmobacter aestuarii TaxID=1445661 RepID=A0A4V3V0T2_9RHOB|nr:efflux RND transporter permease subunit [Gemmobacter aestuarii]THD85122.1 efflux RND transporter permease subunit [Gemmobacter aestuarii]
MARRFEEGKGILSYFTRHRTLANLVLLVMLAAGGFAMTQIRAQYFPDVVNPEVTLSVAWEGAGPDDVDRAIVQVLEPTLLTIDGVTNITSRSVEGSARITLEFEAGHDLGQATEDVQAVADNVGDLPADAEEPSVRRNVWRDRVTDVVITGPVSVDQLGRFADEFVGRLFAAGVTRTTIQGLAADEVVVEVPTVALIRHDVTMAQIASAIAAEAQTAPAGDVGSSGARVRTGSERRGPDQIEAIVLRSLPDGSTLTVGDVATVRVEGADRDRAYFVGNDPAMSIRVDRSEEGDAIRLQATVAEVAAAMQLSLPDGVRVDLVRTRAEQITDRLKLLLDNGAMGLALVVGLLFLFLNARTALWVAAGIPVSMMAAIAIMYWSGMTLNMISLFALIITLGIVVDDAIVVGEHADFRARQLKEPPLVAAENGARRMAMPVAASTLTTVIAFGGLTSIGGNFGHMITDIPWTVIAVLVASLVECFLILPNHMAHALAHAGREAWYDWPSRTVMKGFGWLQRTVVRPGMGWVLRFRYPVLALVVLALSTQAATFVRGDLQFRFFAPPEQASVTGNFAMLPGATREDTLAMMREAQRATEAVAKRFEAEHGVFPLTFVLAEVGGNAGRGLSGADTKDPDLLGGISMELIDPDLRPYSASLFVEALQEEVRAHPRLEELSFRSAWFGPGGDSLAVDLFGASAEELKAAAEALKAALSVYPEVSGLEDTLAYDKEELILNLTAQGKALGFSIDSLGRTLRNRLNGIEAATYPDGPRSVSIRVELPPGELTADFLDRTLMRSGAGQYVPLSDIVTVERRSGFSTIRRENGLRLVSVTGNLAEDDPDRATEVQRALEQEILPRIEADFGVGYRLAGQAEQEREFLGGAWMGLVFSLGGIYLTLAWVFSSWTRPAVVMSVIPFGLVGAIWGHVWWDAPLSMFSIVGLIGMTGIIINDAIVLISTVDEYAEKRGMIPAIMDAVTDRLRPVLLTTLTTVLGLAPLLYETSSQAAFLKPTVITLVYGLGFGMVLVLIVVPALLAVQDDIAHLIGSTRRMIWRGHGKPRIAILGAAAAMALAFAATLGWVAVTGALPGWIASAVPLLDAAPAAGAMALFAFMAGAITVLALLIGRAAGIRPQD